MEAFGHVHSADFGKRKNRKKPNYEAQPAPCIDISILAGLPLDSVRRSESKGPSGFNRLLKARALPLTTPRVLGQSLRLAPQ